MHNERIDLWQHQHAFNAAKQAIEKRTLLVVVITLCTMVAEIAFGWLSNSMALLADGWHMGTHAFALSVSLLAYIMARKYADDHRFTFGTWKIEILGAYTSAVVLGLVGVLMIYSSVERFISPLGIHYDQAMLVAVIGLLVNLLCAVILAADGHSHAHDHDHDDGHEENGHAHATEDLNFKSAYLHVMADAATSVLAIVALLGAKYYQLVWLDPCMGLVGAGLIIRWSCGLLRATGGILLEHEMDNALVAEIKGEIENDGDSKVSDLHVWRVAQNKFACIVSVVTARNYATAEYKLRLDKVHELAHVSIEINQCRTK